MKQKTMKKISLKTLSLVAVLSTMLLSSCQKEKVTPVKTTPETSLKAEASVKRIFVRREMVMAALNGSVAFKNESANNILGCADVNTDSSHMPHATVINYGTAGCLGSDGVTRTGKVLITFDGDYHDAGTIIVTTYNNYYEDSTQITGSDTMQNIGRNGNDHIVYSCSSYEEAYPNTGGLEKNVATGSSEWLAGDATETTDDDQYAYTFTLNKTLVNGDLEIWTSTSANPFIADFSCAKIFVKGRLLCHRPASFDTLWDFGNGTCDNVLTRTENGVTTTETF
jgi:hypothetical protein